MKENKNTYILTIVFLIVVVILLLLNFRIEKLRNKEFNDKVIEKTESKDDKKLINLKLYNVLENKIENKEILIRRNKKIDKINYLNLIIKNLSYTNNTMTVKSIYEIDNNLVIVLSKEFKTLSNNTLSNTINVIKLNIKDKYSYITNVKIIFSED